MEPTATNPQTGEKIVFRGGQWVPMESAPQGRSYPGIIQGRPKAPEAPDPYKVERDRRDFRTDRIDTAFSQASSLRKEFRGLPSLAEYRTALGTFNSSLSTKANAQGDQSLITSYAKMLDPTSAVREGEFATTASTENTLNQIKARLAKEFGFKEGGMLSPEGREFVRQEMWNLVNNRFRPAYETDRTDYQELAERYGYDPLLVVGSDPRSNMRDSISEFGLKRVESAIASGAGKDDILALAGEFGLELNEEDLDTNLASRDAGGDTGEVLAPEGPSEAERIAAERSQGQRDTFGEVGGFLDDAATLGKQGITLGLADEAAGVGGAIGALLTGGDIREGYVNNRDAERIRVENARDRLGVGGTAIELAGGGAGVLSKGGQVVNAARRAAQGGKVTRAATQRQLTRNATRDGAAIGAVGGYGYGEGAEGSAGNALAGAALGGVVGNVGQRAGNALANRSQGGFDAARARQVASAGQAEGVNVNRAMVDPRVQNTFSAVETTRTGGPRINRAMDEVEGQIEGRVRSLGGPNAPEQEAVGEMSQRAAKRFVDKERARAGRLYDKADEAAGGTVVQPSKALDEIDRNIAELKAAGENANRGQIAYLRDIRADIEGGMTIRGLRDQRTNLRGQIKERNLDSTDAERRIASVINAASEDMASALSGKPKRLYTQADKLWREQAGYGKQVRDALIGRADNPKSGTQAARKIESLVRDDAPRFERFWKTLDDTEKAELSGAFAERLGRNDKGEFSPALFLNALPGGKSRQISERTARIMFGEEGAQSLKNLKVLAEEVNRLNSMRNRSNTGRGNNYRAWLLDSLIGGAGTGGVGLMAGGAMAGGVGAVAGAAGGAAIRGARTALDTRMLLNPKVSKWLATAPKTVNPRAIDAHFNRLGDIAKAEPALAGEIEVLRKAVMNAANDNAARGAPLAAENQNTEERP